MVKVELRKVKKHLFEIRDRIFIDNNYAYIPEIVAERLQIEGEPLTREDYKRLLAEGILDRRVFRKYFLSEVVSLGIALLMVV